MSYKELFYTAYEEYTDYSKEQIDFLYDYNAKYISEPDLYKLDQIIDTFKDPKDLTVSAACDGCSEFDDDFDSFDDFADFLLDNNNVEMYITGTIYNDYQFFLSTSFAKNGRQFIICSIYEKNSDSYVEPIIDARASSIQELYDKFVKQLGDN